MMQGNLKIVARHFEAPITSEQEALESINQAVLGYAYKSVTRSCERKEWLISRRPNTLSNHGSLRYEA